jgi:uncharacterized membrane protein
MNGLVTTLTLVSAVACGLMAGIYFTFSNTIMGSLRAQPAPQGIATMQSINEVILNPLFLLLFAGSALTCTALAVTAKFSGEPYAVWRIGAASVFVIGSFVVTMAFNVPLNDSLAAVNPNSEHGAAVWDDYLSKWVVWNHVRTVTSALAAIALTVIARA